MPQNRLPAPLLSPRERYLQGTKLRERMPRRAHADVTLARRDAEARLAILASVNEGRLPALLPEKIRRMRVSPFAFFRGAAVLMAADMASGSRTGVLAQMCGDAHVRNLGAYATPDGTIVFDLNDFDETMPGPWEWDVKRLAASLMLAGEDSGLSTRRCEESVRAFVASYRAHLLEFAAMPFARLGRYLIRRRPEDPLLCAIFEDAERTTPRRNLDKLTFERGGRHRFHDRRPVLQHVPARVASDVLRGLDAYRSTLNASRRRLFERYRPA